MSQPRVSLEDQLFRRLIQDKLDKLKGNAGELKQAAELLADSLTQARAAVKWLVWQNRGLQPEDKVNISSNE
ncbi:MAG: hypothetical protein ACO3ST_02510 [Burkholderiaceae bacterium]